MSIEFYCGSGSPYAWRVWLALEHKGVEYRMHMLSFSSEDQKKPAFLAINPRGKVPVIVDRDLALSESAAIVEYLDDAYPSAGGRLLPAQPKPRALARRLIREADQYLAHAMEALVDEVLFTPPEKQDEKTIHEARDRFVAELTHFERELAGDFFAGDHAGAVDYTVYPMLALALRMENKKKPDLGIKAALGPKLRTWIRRVEALPFYDKTYPPHWKD